MEPRDSNKFISIAFFCRSPKKNRKEIEIEDDFLARKKKLEKVDEGGGLK